MENPEGSWDEVREQFASLAESFRKHLKQVSEQPQGERSDASRKDAKEALRTLADAADRLAQSAESAVRDPQAREDARQAATSLRDALGSTFSELGEEIQKIVERKKGGAGKPPETS